MLFEPVKLSEQKARIAVVGIGGGGGNALNRMIDSAMESVEFIAVNTDAQDLEENNSQLKLQIGRELTKGLGAGANADVGEQAVEENRDIIVKQLDGCDMVFITAGMGGGTGTGAAPAIAKITKELGILTVAVVTKPFAFEGPKRRMRATNGITNLKQNCDTLLVIPNETLLEITEETTSVNESFKLADSVLYQATKGISDLINIPGLINLDFADVKTVMENMGDAIMGTGEAHGDERAILAAQQAINSPLLQDSSIKGSKGLLVNITGPDDMTIHELDSASSIIYEEAGDDANVILGCVIDNNLKDEIRVTVIATGLNEEDEESFTDPNMQEQMNFVRDRVVSNQIENEMPNKGANKDKSKGDRQVFGDNNLDVPTYLRNRK